LVLPNFITGNVNTNWKKLGETIKLAVRLLDNVLDINNYSLKEIEINSRNSRRIGLGALGLADYLFAKGIRYGSERAVYEIERLVRFIRDNAYIASIELAIEKGSFPKFDTLLYSKAKFIKTLPASIRMDIKKYGIRNTSTLAFAPSGTISLVAGKSSGIEPLYAKAYLRKDEISDRVYIHPMYEEFLRSGKEIPDWYVDSYDLSPKDHLDTQVAIQKATCGAISKTIAFPKGTTVDQIDKLLLEQIRDLKGLTIFVDGSREGQIINQLTEQEVKEYLNTNNKIEHSLDEEDVKCVGGSCEL